MFSPMKTLMVQRNKILMINYIQSFVPYSLTTKNNEEAFSSNSESAPSELLKSRRHVSSVIHGQWSYQQVQICILVCDPSWKG